MTCAADAVPVGLPWPPGCAGARSATAVGQLLLPRRQLEQRRAFRSREHVEQVTALVTGPLSWPRSSRTARARRCASAWATKSASASSSVARPCALALSRVGDQIVEDVGVRRAAQPPASDAIRCRRAASRAAPCAAPPGVEARGGRSAPVERAVHGLAVFAGFDQVPARLVEQPRDVSVAVVSRGGREGVGERGPDRVARQPEALGPGDRAQEVTYTLEALRVARGEVLLDGRPSPASPAELVKVSRQSGCSEIARLRLDSQRRSHARTGSWARERGARIVNLVERHVGCAVGRVRGGEQSRRGPSPQCRPGSWRRRDRRVGTRGRRAAHAGACLRPARRGRGRGRTRADQNRGQVTTRERREMRGDAQRLPRTASSSARRAPSRASCRPQPPPARRAPRRALLARMNDHVEAARVDRVAECERDRIAHRLARQHAHQAHLPVPTAGDDKIPFGSTRAIQRLRCARLAPDACLLLQQLPAHRRSAASGGLDVDATFRFGSVPARVRQQA